MFNNREIATIIWLTIGLIWFVLKTKDKNSFKGLITGVFHYKILLPYLLGVVYTLCGVALLYHFGLWTKNEIKDTVLWCVFAVFTAMFDLLKARENKSYFKEALKKNLKFTLIIEFVTGLYTFSIITELILMPVLLAISLLDVFSEKNKRHLVINRFLKKLITLIGLIVIGYTIYEIKANIKEFVSLDTLRNFILSPLLALWFLPFLYLVYLYSTYEEYNISLRHNFKDRKLLSFAKRHAFLKFNIDVDGFDRWKTSLYRDDIITRDDIINSIKELKELQMTEKNPPLIDENTGWSPYKAKEFLTQKGIPTKYYSKGYDDVWFAVSGYIKLDTELAGNTITYSIEGTETTAKTLCLALNINNPKTSRDAIAKLLDYASFLHISALKVPPSEKIKNALSMSKNLIVNDKVNIVVKKEDWLKQGKYSLSFLLKHE